MVNILMRMRALSGCFWTLWMDGVVWVIRGDENWSSDDVGGIRWYGKINGMCAIC